MDFAYVTWKNLWYLVKSISFRCIMICRVTCKHSVSAHASVAVNGWGVVPGAAGSTRVLERAITQRETQRGISVSANRQWFRRDAACAYACWLAGRMRTVIILAPVRGPYTCRARQQHTNKQGLGESLVFAGRVTRHRALVPANDEWLEP